MTQAVSDEVLGKFARKQADWFHRVRSGSLNADELFHTVQQIIDRPRPDFQNKLTISNVNESFCDFFRIFLNTEKLVSNTQEEVWTSEFPNYECALNNSQEIILVDYDELDFESLGYSAGFRKKIPPEVITARAKQFGLDIPDPELALCLRREIKIQPDDQIIIFLKQPGRSYSYPGMFGKGNYGQISLKSCQESLERNESVEKHGLLIHALPGDPIYDDQSKYTFAFIESK